MPPFSPPGRLSYEWLDFRRLGAGAPGAPGGQLQFALLMVAFIALFYFMLIRPQQKRAKEHQALLSKLAAGR